MKYALLVAVFVLASAAATHSQDESQAPETDAEPRSEGASGQSIDESELTFDDDSGSVADGEGEGLTSFGAGDFVRMVLVLALVVLSIYVLFYFLRKASGQGARGNRAVRLLGTTPLQGSRSVHLVEVGGRVYLLGSADQSVRLISEIDDRETVDRLILDYGDGGVAGGFSRRSFPALLGDLFRGSSPGQEAGRSNGRATERMSDSAAAAQARSGADSVSGSAMATNSISGDTPAEATHFSGTTYTERSTGALDAHEHADERTDRYADERTDRYADERTDRPADEPGESGEPPSFLEVQRSRLRQL